jgi:leucine dehydrogenase
MAPRPQLRCGRLWGGPLTGSAASYITAEDVGTGQSAVDHIAETTDHVRGTSANGLGDPSPFTAQGVFAGIKAAAIHRLGARSLDGLTVAIKGLGNVGGAVAERAAKDGATLIVADIDAAKTNRFAKQFNAKVISVDDIHAAEADIFSPCALGGGLNAETIPQLRASIVAGAANNQLATYGDAERLSERGILYAPDFIINAGGVISIALADRFKTPQSMMSRVSELGTVLLAVFGQADAERSTTEDVAIARAKARLTA